LKASDFTKDISMYPGYSKPVSTLLPVPLPRASRGRSLGRFAILAEAVRLIALWRRRARARAELRLLCQLDARTLKDIGLGPDDVQREMLKPFWK